MSRSKTILVGALVVVLALALYGYEEWTSSKGPQLNELLGDMPSDASAVIFLDFDKLRQSAFLSELYKWAPQPAVDADYAQFMRSTGFNYETDLNRIGISVSRQGGSLFALADGRFNRRKISAYAAQSGKRETHGGREVYSVALNGSPRHVTFTFLTDERIALTNGASLEAILSQAHGDADAQEWRERFRRLAGSPVFVVVRPDSSESPSRGPSHGNSLQQGEFGGLLNQLQWVTLAGKPSGDRLRVVCEGESATEAITRQLSEALNGVLALAQAGLSDPKVRQQLQPEVREAYQGVLKSADVTRIDRGETKSVRLIFDLTPQFLEAALSNPNIIPVLPHNKPPTNKGTIRN